MKSLVGIVYEPTGEVWVRNAKNKRLSMLRKCKYCDKEFYADVANVKNGLGFYCCTKHAKYGRGDNPKVDCKCEQCGIEFQEFQSRIDRDKGKFCSKGCYAKSMEKEKIPLPCTYCGKVFLVLPNKVGQQFCSNECSVEARKTGSPTICENCNIVFYCPRWQYGKRFCSRKCAGEVICGENHHLYNPDKIGREAHEFTDKQKRTIFDKYDWKCPVTGKTVGEDEIHIHHIIPISEGGTNVISNGMPLFVDIHKRVHHEGFNITPYVKE